MTATRIISTPLTYICFFAELRRLRSRPADMIRWNESTAVKNPAIELYTAEDIEAANRDCAKAQRVYDILMRRLNRLAAQTA